MTLHVNAPVAGRVVPLSEVPDPVFAQEIVGPGAAIEPLADGWVPVEVVAPVQGRIVKLHPHAFVIVGASGQGVLVHLGIDTVQLRGAGFTLHVTEGDEVEAGEHMVTFSPGEITDGGRSPVCPVVALDAEPGRVQVVASGRVAAGGPLLDWLA